MTFKTWNANGTAKKIHREEILNKAADKGGLELVRKAMEWIGGNEYVSAVSANDWFASA